MPRRIERKVRPQVLNVLAHSRVGRRYENFYSRAHSPNAYACDEVLMLLLCRRTPHHLASNECVSDASDASEASDGGRNCLRYE